MVIAMKAQLSALVKEHIPIVIIVCSAIVRLKFSLCRILIGFYDKSCIFYVVLSTKAQHVRPPYSRIEISYAHVVISFNKLAVSGRYR